MLFDDFVMLGNHKCTHFWQSSATGNRCRPCAQRAAVAGWGSLGGAAMACVTPARCRRSLRGASRRWEAGGGPAADCRAPRDPGWSGTWPAGRWDAATWPECCGVRSDHRTFGRNGSLDSRWRPPSDEVYQVPRWAASLAGISRTNPTSLAHLWLCIRRHRRICGYCLRSEIRIWDI